MRRKSFNSAGRSAKRWAHYQANVPAAERQRREFIRQQKLIRQEVNFLDLVNKARFKP